MIDAILSIFKWIVEGVSNIVDIIVSIPYYIGKVTTFMSYLPAPVLGACSLILTTVVLIKIKRLVFN